MRASGRRDCRRFTTVHSFDRPTSSRSRSFVRRRLTTPVSPRDTKVPRPTRKQGRSSRPRPAPVQVALPQCASPVALHPVSVTTRMSPSGGIGVEESDRLLRQVVSASPWCRPGSSLRVKAGACDGCESVPALAAGLFGPAQLQHSGDTTGARREMICVYH
jgi:hypothetical protein